VRRIRQDIFLNRFSLGISIHRIVCRQGMQEPPLFRIL
jgi:hypothetical protein